MQISKMKNPWISYWKQLALFILSVVWIGCESSDPMAELERSGPVFGEAEIVQFGAKTDGKVLDLNQIVAVAETVRKYKRLNMSEQEIVLRLAEKKIEGFVVVAMEDLKPKYEAKKKVVRQKAAQEITRAMKTEPAPVAAQTKQKIEENLKVELNLIDEDWRAEAMNNTTARYGSNFALPVKNPDGKAVVALVSMRENRMVLATDDAYELDVSPTLLAQASARGEKVAHGQKDYRLMLGANASIGAP